MRRPPAPPRSRAIDITYTPWIFSQFRGANPDKPVTSCQVLSRSLVHSLWMAPPSPLVDIDSMSSYLIAFVTCVYAFIAVEQYLKGNVPGFIIWAGYSFANWGLMLSAK